MVEQVLDSDQEYQWGFTLKDSGYLFGSGGIFFNKEEKAWEIGYNLMHKYWNQGYGTEVAEWLMNMAKACAVRRVTAMTHAQNTASVRILEKLGFKKNNIGWMLFETPDGLQDSQIDSYLYVINEE